MVENLFHQKTEMKKKIKEWEKSNKEKLLLEDSLKHTKKQEKIDNLVTVQDKIAHFDDSKISENNIISEKEINLINVIDKFNSKKTNINLIEKTDATKNCFWIPERTPESISENIKKPEEYLILNLLKIIRKFYFSFFSLGD